MQCSAVQYWTERTQIIIVKGFLPSSFLPSSFDWQEKERRRRRTMTMDRLMTTGDRIKSHRRVVVVILELRSVVFLWGLMGWTDDEWITWIRCCLLLVVVVPLIILVTQWRGRRRGSKRRRKERRKRNKEEEKEKEEEKVYNDDGSDDGGKLCWVDWESFVFKQEDEEEEEWPF